MGDTIVTLSARRRSPSLSNTGSPADTILIGIARALSDAVARLRFGPPVQFVYNPLQYAWEPHAAYLRRFGRGTCGVVLLGMNPGPWGMAQTGVPFGEIRMVRDWLGITGAVRQPPRTHPKRPVLGFECTRSEVSGARLWGWARDTFDSPDRFFQRFFVANYCPLAFFDGDGRNITPDRLPPAHRAPLLAICDDALQRLAAVLQPEYVVGVGRFAERRARIALADGNIACGGILHPSPASPQANCDWPRRAQAQLLEMGIDVP